MPTAPRLIVIGLGAAGALIAAALTLVVFVVLVAVHAQPTAPSFGGSTPSVLALGDIPADYLALYQSAGERYGIDWAVLAGIGKVETDHGRSRLPGVQSGVNSYGCCAGPMQFSIVGPGGGTWGAFGVDGNNDGRRDVYDPADAIPGAGNYLRASGAPRDHRRALLAYNHSAAYRAEVLEWARRYRGGAQKVAAGPRRVVRRPLLGPWLATVPGTTLQCDVRIVNDVLFLLDRFGLIASDCFSTSSVHKALGEHPLGLALDAVPQGGDWRRTLAAARAFRWAESCASSGCEGRLRGPFRVILYNGFPGHGDPAHCRCGGNAHIHFSWQHAPARPFTPAGWVKTLGAD